MPTRDEFLASPGPTLTKRQAIALRTIIRGMHRTLCFHEDEQPHTSLLHERHQPAFWALAEEALGVIGLRSNAEYAGSDDPDLDPDLLLADTLE